MNSKNWQNIAYYFSLLTQLGLTIAITIIGFFFLYKLLTKFIGENIFLMFFLIILGVIAAFYNAYKMILKK
ncbi:AtpZ/AtpI family protein [Hypnocyclicus thermotrophus]|nr:AtpZ/AtpI family protein [Hypnocyclicus thermotrophus]